MRTTNEQTSQIMPKIFFVLFILFCSSIQPAFAQVPALDFDIRPALGTVTVEMKTGSGNVRIILPDDMRAGDTISGTVIATPNVTGVVEGEVIEVKTVDGEVVATKKINSGDKFGRIFIPAGLSAGSYLVLKNSAGKPVAQSVIPFRSNPVPADSIPAQPGDFTPPRIGQTGRNLTIPGNFDGNASNTGINIGGREIPVLAESPRKAVIEIPADTPTGPGNITIKENPANGTPGSQTAPFNVVSVQLKADKLNLLKGETTNLYIFLTGLEGLRDNSGNIRLQIENASPQTVRLTNSPVFQSNGNAGTMPTRVVNADGGNTLMFTEKLTGINPGAFQINATLFDWLGKVIRDAIQNYWKNELNKIAQLKEDAANLVNNNSKAVKDLKENAKKLRALGESSLWDGTGELKLDIKKTLEKEKEELNRLQRVVGANSPAGVKIGEAKNAIDKLAKSMGASK